MAKHLITVSELKCACLDAEWRARWLRGESPPTLVSAASGKRDAFPVQGTAFHQLADQFTAWLVREGKAAAESENPEALWAALYEHFARAKLEELATAGKVPSAQHLSQALRAFCSQAARLRNRMTGFRSWQDVYLTHEFAISAVPFEGGAVLVSGRPDAVRTHPDAGLEVVDYKLSRGANLKHDLLQLAIYARLLRTVKPGLRFSGVLEFYEPALHTITVSVEELDGIFDEIVEPVLAELAQNGPAPAARQGSPSDPTASDPVAAQIEKCYGDFKLQVRVLRRREAPQLVRYEVEPARGVRVSSLANRAQDLQVGLRLRQRPIIEAAPGCLNIDLPKDQPDTVLWKALPPLAAPLSFSIGVGIEGEVLTADFSDPNTCHALIAGTSGSGKSEFLKCLAASLIGKHPPGALRLSIVDPKILTFGALKDSPHLDGPVITDVAAAIACLESAVSEMDHRYAALARGGFESLSQRGARADMPFRVILFDEFADLILSGKSEREQFENLVARLAQKGRAAGIHLVLATQRPDSRIVTGLIKSNLPLKICLRVVNAINSQIVLDQPGAEALLGRGDLLCARGHGLERAQAPYISQEELRALARPG
ncbi:MAG TPA: DNA translocase FtsK [Chthoniobacteraceae bacterium]|nr:DNA translocase FtsK [Chthoniobacteraceae bacterium]